MSEATKLVMGLLVETVKYVNIGTNLGLLYMLWAQISIKQIELILTSLCSILQTWMMVIHGDAEQAADADAEWRENIPT